MAIRDDRPKQVAERDNTGFTTSHVVLLGAGASKAALPSGDANGLEVPLTADIPRVCGLLGLDASLKSVKNFEAYFSDLKDQDLRTEIEKRIRDYFSKLKLPNKATLYDYIVLSLRNKDVIATFNWDPFIWQAFQRNCKEAEMPTALFLHGTVAVGHCLKDMTVGKTGQRCSKCGKPFPESKLLYPVKEKDYSSDAAIKSQWDYLKKRLRHAYIFTIFGYSAPETDVEARSLLKEGWGTADERSLEEIELVNRTMNEDVKKKWDEFIHTHHYRTATDFKDSWTFRHPRRTCEAMFEMLMQVNPYPDNFPPMTDDLAELQFWFAENLIKYESTS
jgi:hypothetical protein